MVLTLLLVQAAKRALAGVPAAGAVPMWVYATAIATGLTFLARYALGSIAGDILELLWQANLAAILAVGGFSVLRQPGATPTNSADGGQKSGGRSFSAVMLAAGLAGLLLAAGGGCLYNPADAIQGAKYKALLTDPNGGTAMYEASGQSTAISKLRLARSPKTGQTLTIGSVSSEDTVAEQQGQGYQTQQQAYLAGATTAMQVVAALMGKQITPAAAAFSPWQPNSNQGLPALPGAAASTAGPDLAGMLAACESAEEQATVLKILGLTPKPKAKPPAKTKTTIPLESPGPATRPAGE